MGTIDDTCFHALLVRSPPCASSTGIPLAGPSMRAAIVWLLWTEGQIDSTICPQRLPKFFLLGRMGGKFTAHKKWAALAHDPSFESGLMSPVIVYCISQDQSSINLNLYLTHTHNFSNCA